MDKETIKLLSDLLDEKLDKKLDEKLEPIMTKLDEHTQILRALEHQAQVNKAEHDKMTIDIAHIKGDVESIKRDLASVELITAKNWTDIAKLKAVKQ